MANTIGNFGDGDGFIYQLYPTGAIDSFVNSAANALKVLARAYQSKENHKGYYISTGLYTQQFYDTVLGSRFYIDTTGAVGVIGGAAKDITNDIIPVGNNYGVNATIASDVATTERYTPFQFVKLSCQSGATDNIKTFTNTTSQGFVLNDIVVFTPQTATDQITFVNSGATVPVTGDNLYMKGGLNFTLTGRGSTIAFRKVTISSGPTVEGWEEIWRSGDAYLQVINKSLTAGGGTYNMVSDATNPILSDRIILILTPAAILTGSWTITADAKPGQEIEVVMASTCRYNAGISLTILGISVNEYLAETTGFVIKSYYDMVTAAYVSRIVISQTAEVSGNYAGVVGTTNATNCSANSVTGRKSTSGTNDSFGVIELSGTLTMAVTVAFAASAKTLVTAASEMWKPRTNKKFICTVKTGSDEATKMCMVEFTYGGIIQVYAISGFNLAIGDIIDVSNIRFTAYETGA